MENRRQGTISFQERVFYATKPLGELPTTNTNAFKFKDVHKLYKTRMQLGISRFLTKTTLKGFMCLGRSFYYNYFTNHNFLKYKLRLHTYLRVNITMQDTYFPHSPQGTCKTGFIRIVDDLPNILEKILRDPHWYPCGDKNINNEGLKYCGIFSKISSFPMSNTVDVEVNSGAPVIIRANLSYSIIDIRSITSKKETDMKQAMPVWGVTFVETKIDLNYYKIITEHYKYICVEFSDSLVGNHTKPFLPRGYRAEVHDGPGNKNRKLRKSNPNNKTEKYISSNFQIVMYIFVHSIGTSVQSFKYSSLRQTGWVSVQHQGNLILTLPSERHCIENLCLFILHSSLTQSYNISFENSTYEGTSMTDSCEFAGVSVYHNNKDKYLHVSTECVRRLFSISGDVNTETSDDEFDTFHFQRIASSTIRYPDQKAHPTVYSQGSQVSLIFFAYKEYGNLTVELNIQSVRCQVANVDLCDTSLKKGRHPRRVDFWHKLPWQPGCSIIQVNQSTTCPMVFTRTDPGRELLVSVSRHRGPGLAMKISGSGALRGRSSSSFSLKALLPLWKVPV